MKAISTQNIRNIRILLLSLLCMLPGARSAFAQELNCNVEVLHPQVQTTNASIFPTLQNAVREFMNTTKWTQDNFGSNEKIECFLVLTIDQMNGSEFSGSLQVSGSRPAYGTNYNAATFNYLDKKFKFSYVQSQPVRFQDGVYMSELSSILAFYAYIIIGYDYDTYSLNGGAPYFQKALSIVNSAQSSTASGWSSMEKDEMNRYYIANALISDRYQSFHKFLYQYYRHGIDLMAQDNVKAVENILEAMELLKQLRQDFFDLNVMTLFFNRQRTTELVCIFQQGNSTQQEKICELMQDIDPVNGSYFCDKLKNR